MNQWLESLLHPTSRPNCYQAHDDHQSIQSFVVSRYADCVRVGFDSLSINDKHAVAEFNHRCSREGIAIALRAE